VSWLSHARNKRKIPSSILGGNNGLTEKFSLQFSLDRKQAGISLRMVNWKYFLKNAALIASMLI
jgi:hypothetical protein